MSQSSLSRRRPLSPHLSVYRLTLTMAMSMAHRITGASLYVAMLFLVWWLMAAAAGPNAYATLQAFMGSIIGQIVLVGSTWALLHHALGGIRHLIWDTGYGLEPNEREWLARATLIGSIGLTIILGIIGYMIVGKA